jgi:hypothetical protein
VKINDSNWLKFRPIKIYGEMILLVLEIEIIEFETDILPPSDQFWNSLMQFFFGH